MPPWTKELPLNTNNDDRYVDRDYVDDDYVEGLGGNAPLDNVWTPENPRDDSWL